MRGTSTRSVAAMPHASAKEERGTITRFANGEIQHRRLKEQARIGSSQSWTTTVTSTMLPPASPAVATILQP